MKIHIYNTQDAILIKPPYWRKLVKEIALFEGQEFKEVAIHFVNSKTIGELHEEYFDDPSVTDCISFPLDGPLDPYPVLGDAFVCTEVACAVAKRRRESPIKEAALYVVHAILHLFGYDDMNKLDRQRMKKREKEHMTHLSAKGFF